MSVVHSAVRPLLVGSGDDGEGPARLVGRGQRLVMFGCAWSYKLSRAGLTPKGELALNYCQVASDTSRSTRTRKSVEWSQPSRGVPAP
jgi:hypothetical protein